LLDILRDQGLLNAEQLARLAPEHTETKAGRALFERLVGAGFLTDYQARRVWNGQIKGLVLGQYHVLAELGRGGFGQVYKARHTVMDRVVAIKVIAPELVQDQRARDWFRREVLTITQLYHRNIVMAYDAHEANNALFLVMEFVDGLNLEFLVQKQGPLPIAVTCEMMRQAGQALQYAHEKGMVHRDIKPANMLIPREACVAAPHEQGSWRLLSAPGHDSVLVKVVDFGLARLHNGGKTQTLMVQNESSFLGTPDYVSPEQARNVHAADIRSDLYSLGCTFYFALTGLRPFKSATALETVVKHLEKDPEPLQSIRPEIPAALAAVVSRLMLKDPGRRFQTPAEMLAELDFLCGTGDVAAKAARPGPRPAPSGVLLPVVMASPRSQLPTNKVRPVAPTAGPQGAGVLGTTAMPAPTPAAFSVVDTAVEGAANPTPPPLDLERPAAEVSEAVDADEAPVDAVEPEPVGTLRDLQKAWNQWVDVVEAYAGAEGRVACDERAYRQLHRGLLEMCQSRTHQPGSMAGVYQRMETVLEPWVTSEALKLADEAALVSLLQQCQELDLELGNRRGGRGFWLWFLMLAASLMVVVSGWQWYREWAGVSTKITLAGAWKTIQVNPVLTAAVVVPLAVILSLGSLMAWIRR
jgi:serine/threonine-protein kinase